MFERFGDHYRRAMGTNANGVRHPWNRNGRAFGYSCQAEAEREGDEADGGEDELAYTYPRSNQPGHETNVYAPQAASAYIRRFIRAIRGGLLRGDGDPCLRLQAADESSPGPAT